MRRIQVAEGLMICGYEYTEALHPVNTDPEGVRCGPVTAGMPGRGGQAEEVRLPVAPIGGPEDGAFRARRSTHKPDERRGSTCRTLLDPGETVIYLAQKHADAGYVCTEICVGFTAVGPTSNNSGSSGICHPLQDAVALHFELLPGVMSVRFCGALETPLLIHRKA